MEPAASFAALLAAVCLLPAVVALATNAAGFATRVAHPAARSIGLLALVGLLRTAPAEAVPPPAVRLAPEPDAVGAPPQEAGADGAPTSESYRVAAGDSLWAIACRHLARTQGETPTDDEIDRHWRSIYARNRTLIGNDPHLIFPGQVLILPEVA